MLSKLTEEKAMMEDACNTSRSELEAIKATSLNFQSQLTESSRKLNEVCKASIHQATYVAGSTCGYFDHN